MGALGASAAWGHEELPCDMHLLTLVYPAQIDSEKSGEITAEQLAEWKAKFGA